jgi:hypothetical protein
MRFLLSLSKGVAGPTPELNRVGIAFQTARKMDSQLTQFPAEVAPPPQFLLIRPKQVSQMGPGERLSMASQIGEQG